MVVKMDWPVAEGNKTEKKTERKRHRSGKQRLKRRKNQKRKNEDKGEKKKGKSKENIKEKEILSGEENQKKEKGIKTMKNYFNANTKSLNKSKYEKFE